ncbi:hypothetical protein TNCV_1028781 [Trichonephila clavipes]|nr:hypothetical protein TNCV_1028781 [Trichonephila clavipes]
MVTNDAKMVAKCDANLLFRQDLTKFPLNRHYSDMVFKTQNKYKSGDGIFDVKDAPRTGRPVVKNVDKITEIIETDRHVSSRSFAKKLKIDHKTVLSHLSKVGFKKKAPCLGATPTNTKSHDGSSFHLRSFVPNGTKSTHFLREW